MNDAEPPQPTLTGDEFFPVPETPAPAPPPPPEDGAALLDEVCDAIARYVILPSAAETTAAALWAACTHAQPAWEFASRLVIKAPLKQCGKSRLLNVMEALSYNAVATINISPAALVHEIGDDPPSLFLDEADVTFRRRGGETSETAELLRGILNGGAERGKPYIRRNHAARCNERVSTFCMVAAAGIGDWAPDTLEDRAIIVSMRRRGPGESVAPLRRRDLPALHQLRERLHQWARAHLDELRAAVPEMPVQDRDADVWEPLVALADAAGGHWPETARAACIRLTSHTSAEAEATARERILEDVREVFGDDGQLYTSTILERLHALEEAPWCDWYGHLLRPRDLAGLLRPYGIRPKQLREGGTGEPLKGYTRKSFADAWSRYCPPSLSPGEQGEHEEHGAAS